MKSIIVFMAIFALASASNVRLEKSESVDEESGKVFVANNNMGSLLALNSTFLVIGVVLILAVAVAALALLGGGDLGLGQAYKRYGNQAQTYFSDEAIHETRYKRFALHGNVIF